MGQSRRWVLLRMCLCLQNQGVSTGKGFESPLLHPCPEAGSHFTHHLLLKNSAAQPNFSP